MERTAPHLLDSMLYCLTSGVFFCVKSNINQTILNTDVTSGKTTLIQTLNKLINTGDFNFVYLKKLLCPYKVSSKKFVLPTIEFKINVRIEKNNKDLINNLVPFMTLNDINKSELDIFIIEMGFWVF